METATLTKWSQTFGFLDAEDGRGDVYVHRQEFERAGLEPCVGGAYVFDAVIDTRRPGQRRAARIREA